MATKTTGVKAGAKKTTTRKKATTKTTTRKTAAKKQTISVQEFLELARQEAFLVYQNRVSKGLPGDATSDWIEAEKNLKKKYEVVE